uniref:DAZ interacting zinc finger protein 1 like n=1 Tax=Apteryx owenii TaxID=8824 RepID=A0A8B9NT47_APTOW
MQGSVQTLDISAVPPFQFQPRRASVDWRRFSAIDVERVARELDVATLQEHIASVTFCNLDSERCPSCQQPVDPVLLKVLKMAQLSIEYLLHCQESLSAALALQAGRLQAALDELACEKQEAARQAEELRGVKEESRRRKKLIATQQLILQAGANSYHKCQLCDKAFVNYSFLQAHIQRRHTEASERKKQVEQMEDEIQELKVKLRETQQRLEAERDMGKLLQEHETERARWREQEGRRVFERWKEEERTKLRQELDSLRQLFLDKFKDIASRSSAMEGKVQELQARSVAVSNLGTLQDDDCEEKQQGAATRAELQDMRERMDVQVRSHVKLFSFPFCPSQLKSENEKLRATLSQDQRAATDHFRQEMDKLSAQLRDQTEVIKSQEKTVHVTREAPKVAFAEEWSEEENALRGKQRLLKALRRNPHLLEQFRPILEEMLAEKLESMGVKRVAKGISTQTYENLQTLVRIQQQQKADRFPEFLRLRDKLIRAVKWKVRQREKPNGTFPQQLSVIPGDLLSKPKEALATSSVTAIVAAHGEGSCITAWSLSSPPASSSEQSPHHPQPSGDTPRDHPDPQGQQPHQPAVTSLPTSDGGEQSSCAGQDSLCDWTTVSAMVKVLERRLDTTARKPAGGVKLFPERSSGSPKASDSSDLDNSSLEDLVAPRELPAGRRRPPARRGGDPAGSPGTSAWSSGSAATRCW